MFGTEHGVYHYHLVLPSPIVECAQPIYAYLDQLDIIGQNASQSGYDLAPDAIVRSNGVAAANDSDRLASNILTEYVLRVRRQKDYPRNLMSRKCTEQEMQGS
jgi:hypothetical protein